MVSSAGCWAIFCLLAVTLSTVSAQQVCRQVDLCFLVDSSGSINYKAPRNWNLSLEFIVEVVRDFSIGPNGVQVALVLFSTTADVRWGLTQYNNNAPGLIAAIRSLPYRAQETNLNDALYLARTQVFTSGNTRPNARMVTIILTDGEDNVPRLGTPLTLRNASELKRQGVEIMAVGVSGNVSERRLKDIVTDENRDYYRVDDFGSLRNIVDRLRPSICYPCALCTIELAFLLDSSTKTNTTAWSLMRSFVSEVVRQYNISFNCVRVAVIRYSNTADAPIRLNSYSEVNSLVQAISQIQLLVGSASNLHIALNLLVNQVFASNVIRSNIVPIAIIVTDNLQQNNLIPAAANNARRQGIVLVGVAITGPGRVNVNYFNTSVVSDYRLVQVNDYSQLISGARNRISQEHGCIPYTATLR